MNKLALSSALLIAALLQAGCSSSESDGRKYYSNASPLQGKMGVTFKRVHADAPPAEATASATTATTTAADGTVTTTTATTAPATADAEGPPGLLDKFDRPDEPGAEYWMHGQLSPNPIQSKMGVRVERRKK